mmetsp:Transcript_26589/g.37045  ORF Transcript_26589/g.37045 Transcript_26589/m.37045 type:complete len:253 (-) Transcript_26589:129-887(-)|eukprot:CAMPEP_0184480788 /NCGR_PEP_ID=MMETSP0113_2-20130426/2309_1 /TAXON_ID=91329 /ORGANISM="Norrisiella sphaerica, Strain BC52" /LENGTH=252 /DNA_ID=CAMNT_0026859507 /DNA_START=88 /DNA_END=846 /DNA_ORIENTATION=-
MFRNDYDTDVTTFSPAGRIHQVEYAIAAVKQGSACVALKSDEYAVLACVMRKESELGSHQEKLFKVDDHMGIGISGLIADGRVLCKYLRTECLNHKFVFEGQIQVGRLVKQLSDKSQKFTQTSEKRPYGVGLLVIGYDETGTHVYETVPSGNFFEYIAQAMGKRSQSARTYLEKYFKEFKSMELGDLVKHSLKSLKGASEETLTKSNCAIAYVGKDKEFTIITGEELAPYMALVDDGDEKKEESKSSEAKNN